MRNCFFIGKSTAKEWEDGLYERLEKSRVSFSFRFIYNYHYYYKSKYNKEIAKKNRNEK